MAAASGRVDFLLHCIRLSMVHNIIITLPRMLHGYCMDVAWMLHGCCMDVAWMLDLTKDD
jgi:hypothetical protein